jgi:hypothetical protein
MPQRAFVPRPGALTELASDEPMGKGLAHIAGAGVPIAAAFAPVDEGDYQRSIHPMVELTALGFVGYIVADDYKAVMIEHGTGPPGPTPAHQPLRRAAEALGLQLRGE